MRGSVEGRILRIIHVRRNLARNAEEKIVFHPMRRHAEMQPLGANCVGKFSSGVAVRTHFGHGPVAQAAVIHRKTIVMLRHGHDIFRSGLLE